MKPFRIAICIILLACYSTFADSTPSLESPLVVSVNPFSPAVERDTTNWTQLMWAVYCGAHPQKIRQSRAAYDSIIVAFDSMPDGSGRLETGEKSFIYTQRAILRFHRLQDIRGAKADCEQAIELNPGNVQATWMLARVFHQLTLASIRTGKQTETGAALLEQLITTLKRVIELDADHAEAHEMLFRFAEYLGHTELAMTSLKALTRILPFDPQFHLRLSELYEEVGQLPEAIKSYERIVTINPQDASHRNRLGQLYLQMNDFENAVTAFNTVFALVAPQQATLKTEGTLQIELDALFGIGIAYQGIEDFTKSEIHLLKAIELTAEQVRNTRNRSARADLRRRIREVQYALGQVYLQFEEKDGTQKALNTFASILETAPQHVGANYGSGIAHQVLGNAAEAETYLQKAISLSAKPIPDAYNALGYLYAQQGIKLDEAASLVEQALRAAPTSGAYLDSLGVIYFKQGHLDAAIETLEKADRYLPNTPDILLHLGEAYLKKGWAPKARQVFERALEIAPENTELQNKLDAIE